MVGRVAAHALQLGDAAREVAALEVIAGARQARLRVVAANQRALLIPEGFAHGLQTLTDECELLYLHSAAYRPEAEAGLNPRDPMLSINWPQAITDLSARDAQHAMLDYQFKGVKP
jgi:dTDP-4-dehydrorhamnose 3,5-epimerase-like enzyme